MRPPPLWGRKGHLVPCAIEGLQGTEQFFTPVHMLEVLMVLSLVKAALIIAYFMHLKFEIPLMRFMLMAAIVACLCIMCIFFADAVRVVKLGLP